MRLIDADKLESLCDIMADKCDGIGESIWSQFRTTVEWSPTIDPMKRGKHGKWMKIHDRWWRNYFCSECRAEFMVETCMLKPMWNYCPNCGAEMDGDADA